MSVRRARNHAPRVIGRGECNSHRGLSPGSLGTCSNGACTWLGAGRVCRLRGQVEGRRGSINAPSGGPRRRGVPTAPRKSTGFSKITGVIVDGARLRSTPQENLAKDGELAADVGVRR